MYISDYYATNRVLGARQCSEVFGSNRRAACLGGLVRASFRSLDICFAKEYLHRVTSVQIRGIWQHRNIIRYVLLILSEYFSTGFTAVSRGLQRRGCQCLRRRRAPPPPDQPRLHPWAWTASAADAQPSRSRIAVGIGESG